MKSFFKYCHPAFALLLPLLFSGIVHCQTIHTIAGTGRFGFSGDGGISTGADLHSITSVAKDTLGNIYFVDSRNYRIRKIDLLGVISTIAGNGSDTFSGDGGAATAAGMTPYKIAFDRRGNLYFTDMRAYRVRKIDASGIVTTVVGSGYHSLTGENVPATAAGLSNPYGITFDATGNMYVSVHHCIRKIDTAGIITTFAGSARAGFSGDGGPASAACLYDPYDMAFDRLGNFYVADWRNNRVRKINTSFIVSTIAGNGGYADTGDGGPATNAALNGPFTLAIDTFGNIFVSSALRIRKVDTSGYISLVAGLGNTYTGDEIPATAAGVNPFGLYYDKTNGYLYVADGQNNRVRVIGNVPVCSGTPAAGRATAHPAAGSTFTPFTLELSGYTFHTGVTIQWQRSTSGASGPFTNITGATNYYYSFVGLTGDTHFRAIVACSGMVDTSNAALVSYFPYGTCGTITTIAGRGNRGFTGENGPAALAYLNNPTGITGDTAGNLYFEDCYNQKIRKISPAGTITTIAGTGSMGYSGDGGPATAATIYNPTSLAMDGAGNLFIADYYNHVIRKITPSGIISTIAGTGMPGYSGDGGMATAAMLNYPFEIAVDAIGNVYVIDIYSNRVRKVTPGGIISTVAGNGTTGFSGDGGPATAASFHNVSGISVDDSGALFIGDGHNMRLRKVNTAGIINTVAGNGTAGITGDGGMATAASFMSVGDVELDGSGNIYFYENGNYKVRMVDRTGILHTVAGSGAYGFGGDEGPATAAELGGGRLYIDVSGNLFITDGNWQVIRKVAVAVPQIVPIVGPTTATVTDSIVLSNPRSGGVWGTSNPTAATVSGHGVVTGLSVDSTIISYTVWNGCDSATVYKTIIVLPIFPLGVTTNTETSINIYPNPASTTIQIDAPGKVNVVIADAVGTVVSEQQNVRQVNLSGYRAGIYIIKVLSKDGEVLKVAKVVKVE